MNEVLLEQPNARATKVPLWLGVISTVLTIILTAANAYSTHRINQITSEIELRKVDLEKLNVSVTEGKERMARYAFVQSLFGSVLNEKDAGQRTLAINLINLALTEPEATKLFAGLQASSDQRTQEIGNIGSDLVSITDLVVKIDAVAKESRIGAVDTLIKKYRADARAIDLSLSLLELPKLEQLSASGRVNVLVFLRNTERSAWTPELLLRAERAIANIQARHESRVAPIGGQTKDSLNQLIAHLADVKRQ
jgi:hypothetical protein